MLTYSSLYNFLCAIIAITITTVLVIITTMTAADVTGTAIAIKRSLIVDAI